MLRSPESVLSSVSFRNNTPQRSSLNIKSIAYDSNFCSQKWPVSDHIYILPDALVKANATRCGQSAGRSGVARRCHLLFEGTKPFVLDRGGVNWGSLTEFGSHLIIRREQAATIWELV
jgi:hypothetical protein